MVAQGVAMYVLIAYDVQTGRTEKFRKILSKYLIHEQNSVFAGDLPMSELKRLHDEISKVAVADDRLMEVISENRHNISVSILRKNRFNGVLEAEEHAHHLHRADIL